MNIEELQEQLLNLQSELKDKNELIEGLNIKLQEKEENLKSLSSDLQSVKAKNFDLFMQVSNNIPSTEHKIQDNDLKITPMGDIINILMEGE